MQLPVQNHISLLQRLYPRPPTQSPVGRNLSSYILRIQDAGISLKIPDGLNLGQLSRVEVKTLCTDLSIEPLLAYAAAMAWGGQNYRFFELSLRSKNLVPLVERFREEKNSRAEDFDFSLRKVPGLGISFFTKLLFFCRPQHDSYILDQWTAKGIVYLYSPNSPVQVNGFGLPDPATTGEAYDRFCQSIESIALALNWTPEDVELAIFGGRSSPWRSILNGHFEDGEERKIANSVVATAKGSEISQELAGDFLHKVNLAQRIQQKHLEALESNAGAPENGSLEGAPDSNTVACQNAVPPKSPTLQGNPKQPVRLYLGAFNQNKGIWQYQIGSKKITVNIFFSREIVNDYKRLVLNSGAVEVRGKHDFGNQIVGNGPDGGVTRSISHSIRTKELGEDLDSIADAAVDAMGILWRKFCDKL